MHIGLRVLPVKIGFGVPMVRFFFNVMRWVIAFTINLYGLIICMPHLHAGAF